MNEPAERVVHFDWELAVRPPFGVWRPVGGGLEARVFAGDPVGSLRIRHLGKVDIVHPDDTHDYWSTHCRHGDHEACSATEIAPGVPRNPACCKTCKAPCLCPCGHGSTTQQERE